MVTAAAGPSLSWNVFDFGRIRNNVRVQDARLEQTLEAYQEAVLQAAREVDDTAVSFAKTKESILLLEEAERVSKRAHDIALINFQEGFSDFQRLLTAQAALLRQQDLLVSARGQNAIALILVYKAIAGAWSISEESDYISEESIKRMQDRTNWGNFFGLVVNENNTTDNDEGKDNGTEKK